MSAELVTINNAAVMRDSVKTWRWFDAFGPNVTKWDFNPHSVAIDDTTGVPDGYTGTKVNTSTCTLVAGADGGAVLLTTDTAENDGIELQHDTEGFYFASRWPAYFGCKFQVNDADATDTYLGLAITDTSAATAVSDGIGFWSVDGATAMNLSVCKNYTGTTGKSDSEVATLADSTAVTAEWYFDGTTLTAYINGSEAASIAYSSTSFPNDEYLAPVLALLNGSAAGAAGTMTIYWAKAFQIREA